MATEETESSGIADLAACEGSVSASDFGVLIRQILRIGLLCGLLSALFTSQDDVCGCMDASREGSAFLDQAWGLVATILELSAHRSKISKEFDVD